MISESGGQTRVPPIRNFAGRPPSWNWRTMAGRQRKKCGTSLKMWAYHPNTRRNLPMRGFVPILTASIPEAWFPFGFPSMLVLFNKEGYLFVRMLLFDRFLCFYVFGASWLSGFLAFLASWLLGFLPFRLLGLAAASSAFPVPLWRVACWLRLLVAFWASCAFPVALLQRTR